MPEDTQPIPAGVQTVTYSIALMPTNEVLQWQCVDCHTEKTYEWQAVEIPFVKGNHTLLTTVPAAVCSQCGCVILGDDSAARLDDVQAAFEEFGPDGFTVVGNVYRPE